MPTKRKPRTTAGATAGLAAAPVAPKYDVAISFLSRDEAIASALHAELAMTVHAVQ